MFAENHKRRIVVTGIGPVSAIGVGASAFLAAQHAGQSGVGPITRFDASTLPVRIAAEVTVNPEDFMERKELRYLDRSTQLAIIAADLALADAGLDPKRVDSERAGCLIGTGIGGMKTWQEQSAIMMERGPMRLSPFFITMLMANAATGRMAIRYGFGGPSSAVATACSTGAEAIGNAVRLMQYGEADVMLAGGTEAVITEMAIGGFAVMRALSTNNDSPATASRPFDHARDGFVLGEGAGVMVLETLEHAQARGARILVELTGFGRSADAYHIAEPHPEGNGVVRSMRACLKDAGLNPADIGYINAHATSTPLGDRAEVKALSKLFGEHLPNIPISSSKSMIGHTLGAAGALEAIVTIQAIVSGVLPPTINLDHSDFDLDLLPNVARHQPIMHGLSNSFAFGGLNAALVFSKLA
jgi:3-oxoacyl-[acyl-carrier-protein] synthase II